MVVGSADVQRRLRNWLPSGRLFLLRSQPGSILFGLGLVDEWVLVSHKSRVLDFQVHLLSPEGSVEALHLAHVVRPIICLQVLMGFL